MTLDATRDQQGPAVPLLSGGRGDLLYAVAEHEAAQVIADQQPFLDDLGRPAAGRRGAMPC
jgi:hypothetical protein